MAYCLRSGVTCWLQTDKKPLLVLDFPLRAVAVKRCWQALLARLATGDVVPLDALSSSVPDISLEQTENFLEYLVRKAFCRRKGTPVPSRHPYVSIIVPVRNRQKDLARCLESLSKLRYPAHKMEIIVVDDDSADDSLHVAKQFPVRAVALKRHKQVSYCRNFAARQAKGEILAFIDSDCVADPSWLKELIPTFNDPSVGAVGGLVDSYFNDKALDRYEKVKSSLQVSTWYKRSGEQERFFYVPACNLLVRRHLFLDLGGFREDLHVGEDVDLCWRLQNQGEALEYRPVGKVFHKHRNRLLPFCRRRFQYGTSEPTLQQLHPDRVKQLRLPLPEFLFWVFLAASAYLSSLALLLASAVIIALDICQRYVCMKKKHIPIRMATIAGAVIRSSLSLCYHLCSFISRYYLVFCAALWPLRPWLSMGALMMHGLTGIIQYKVLKPRLNLITFLALFTLEQISYQLGVWWGCLARMHFKPMIPRLVFIARALTN